MRGIVQNGLLGHDHLRFAVRPARRVGVAIIAREIAARNLDPHAVSGEKDVARGCEVDVVFLHVPRRQQRGLGLVPLDGSSQGAGQGREVRLFIALPGGFGMNEGGT